MKDIIDSTYHGNSYGISDDAFAGTLPFDVDIVVDRKGRVVDACLAVMAIFKPQLFSKLLHRCHDISESVKDEEDAEGNFASKVVP